MARLSVSFESDLRIGTEGGIAHASLSSGPRESRLRAAGPLLFSLLINILLLIGILLMVPPRPILTPQPIPVQIVPPPVAKPKPVLVPRPQPKQPAAPARQPPPPPPTPPEPQKAPAGNLSSVDTGSLQAPLKSTLLAQAPEAGPQMPEDGASQATSAANTVDMPLIASTNVQASSRKMHVKHGGARHPVSLAPPQNVGHHAKYPGPDANYDQYMAYALDLISNCGTGPSREEIATQRQPWTLQVTIRRNGAVLWAPVVAKSSGSPTLDQALITQVGCVARFPPVPDYIPGDTITLTYSLQTPGP